jgi:probable F420-dependent oxidoreductase
VRFWAATAFLPTDEVLALAQVCDDAGWYGMSVSDHVFAPAVRRSKYPYTRSGEPFWAADAPWPDPWVLIGAMAAVTSRLRFTTNVYVAPARDLFTVAKLVSTAAVVSGGRVALGVGAGWCEEEFEQMGQPFAGRGRRLDEMIEVLRALWRGGPVEHRGDHYAFDPLQIAPVPPSPVPVYVGGDSPAALRRAARLGDGWIGNAYSEEGAVAKLSELRAALSACGRPPEGFEVVLALKVVPSLDLYRRFADLGVTGLLCAPWALATSAAERVEAARRFGEEIVAPLAG